MQVDHAPGQLSQVDPCKGGFRHPGKVGKFGYDLFDAAHFTEHRSACFVEVLVECVILPCSQSAQRLDGRLDRGQRILDLVGYLSGEFASRGDAFGDREPTAHRIARMTNAEMKLLCEQEELKLSKAETLVFHFAPPDC